MKFRELPPWRDAITCSLEEVAVAITKHEPGSDLTVKQRKAAQNLRAQRPMTIPGSNAIIVRSEATEWHNRVATVALAAKITPAQEKAFFDLAGVAE